MNARTLSRLTFANAVSAAYLGLVGASVVTAEQAQTTNKTQVADLGLNYGETVERVTRIELALSAWEATALAGPYAI
ncbi:hypothetical protein [Streptomyces sp. NBC_00009]|uniref:hypothetical protein n=1 Tax=Streptomyces sp. NBC_00009 TaxID=2975620 RepID=UPI0032470126